MSNEKVQNVNKVLRIFYRDLISFENSNSVVEIEDEPPEPEPPIVPTAPTQATEGMTDELAKIDQLMGSVEQSNRDSPGERMRLSSFGITSPSERSKRNEKTQVMWEDPKEEKTKKRLTRSLDKTQQQSNPTFADSMDIPDNLTEQLIEEEKENQKVSNMTQACFSFSNFRDEVREKYINFVQSVGGQVSEMNQFCDPKATHVVAQKMSRSEKMLGSICSGKWIIHEDYILACMKENRLLENFADYEWGNEANGYLDTLEKPMEKLNAQGVFHI